MSDIEHWINSGAPPDVVEALKAARAEAPNTGAVERCALLAAGAGSSLALSTADALATSAKLGATGVSKAASLGALTLAKWGVGGLIAGGALMTSVELVVEPGAPAPQKPEAALSRGTGARAVESRATAPAHEPARSLTPSPTLPVERETTRGASSISSERRLAEELGLLERVRASLDAGNLAGATRLLGEHSERFGPASPLAPEARYLKLMVLQASQRPSEAQALAREIIERDPSGPHVARARAVLEGSPDKE